MAARTLTLALTLYLILTLTLTVTLTVTLTPTLTEGLHLGDVEAVALGVVGEGGVAREQRGHRALRLGRDRVRVRVS